MRRLLLTVAALALASCGPTTGTNATATDTSLASATAEEIMRAGTPCAADAQPAGETHTYSCANSVSFSVRFDTGATCAFVSAGGQTYRLGAAISGSGARYSDGTTQYWDHAPDAMLEGATGGPYEECRTAAP